MKTFRPLLAAAMILFFVSCPAGDKATMYRDDEGNFLESGCDVTKKCDNKHAVIIKEYLVDKNGNPNLNETYDFVFCCDTVVAIADTIKDYAAKMAAYYAQIYGRKFPKRETSLFFIDYRRLKYYNNDSDAIWLKPKFTILGDSLQADSIKLRLISKSGFAISFTTQKTAEAFADSLRNAWATCCE